ncbi:MAG TPA: DMT family transporter [Terracidiphilus sp.]|nr:DMT family transporter [Terracidiphilus sp.]
MAGSGASAGLGLISAASWGGSDFVGGLGARRAPALLVVISGQILSLAALLTVCFGLHLALPDRYSSFCAIVGGFIGALSLAAFYRALAMGAMGLTAALTGLLTAGVPVAFSFLHDGLPGPANLGGLAAGCVAIWLITHRPDVQSTSTTTAIAQRTALLLGTFAGCGFGTQLILLKLASTGGVLWAMTWTRAAGVAALLLVVAVRRPIAPRNGFLWIGLFAGALDTSGNLFYIMAARAGRLDVAALVASLYPAITILLAALVLGEHPTGRQFAGMGLALAAVLLLST